MRSLVFLAALVINTVGVCSEVRLKCWIVSDDDGNGGRTENSVSNLVSGVNSIYTQAAICFVIDSISSTNSTYFSTVNPTNTAHWYALCSVERSTDCLELYFIPDVEGDATAFQTKYGIVVGPVANARTLAHEIGHACDLPDIYVSHAGTSLAVAGPPSKDRMPDDWGWYPPSVTQEDLIKRLLMYGVYSTTKADISYGDVYGLHYTNTYNSATRVRGRAWFLDMAPIGFGVHAKRNPKSL